LLTPVRFAINHPWVASIQFTAFALIIYGLNLAFVNTNTIIVGTNALRHPASTATEVENTIVEFSKKKFEVEVGAGGGGHGGASKAMKLIWFLISKLKQPILKSVNTSKNGRNIARIP